MNLINNEAARQAVKAGLSRRSFGRIASVVGAASALPILNEAALAQLSSIGRIPSDAVKINANENPLGPCAEALEVMHKFTPLGGRYLYEETFDFIKTVGSQEGVKPEYIKAYGGSSLPLHHVVMAFTGADKSLVTADPGYEAAYRAATVVGAKYHLVPLKKTDYSHDVKAMYEADPNAGVYYICNPNNPSGTITPMKRLTGWWPTEGQPDPDSGTKAYIHLAPACPWAPIWWPSDEERRCILRTFSKLYGMAGLRAGFAMARPDLLKQFAKMDSGAISVTAMTGAHASIKNEKLVPQRAEIIRNIREDVFAFLDKKNFSYIPSVSNKFLLDVKMPAREFSAKMAAEKIYVGRAWPSMPTHSRVSIGTAEEMGKFKAALAKVMA
ncbi:MAG: aminotransferase class I/II-fold pyridoxal phosphate-dependent enzyme [Bryobacterales bacterium]|nr:aminotransferase class I/II-fold pyridoxal phosphate-dependent enzyme [Bryobacterales bacterium]